jgi:hypothetical protein
MAKQPVWIHLFTDTGNNAGREKLLFIAKPSFDVNFQATPSVALVKV